jgi:O-antigen ligase
MTNDLIINKSNYSLGFPILIIFACLRPIVVGIPQAELLNILDTFGIIISFLILVSILINIKSLKVDFINLMILVFCSYCYLSIFWDSDIREVAKYTLPFLLFFSARISVKRNEQIAILLKWFILGYSYLILASFFAIITGSSDIFYEYSSDLERYGGVTTGSHTLAHMMMFYNFIFAYYIIIGNRQNKIMNLILFLLFILSVYCLVMTYTRTTLIGFAIFWAIYLSKNNKKVLLIGLLISLPLFGLFADKIEIVFLQNKGEKVNKVEDVDINRASSGRLYLWERNLTIFAKSDPLQKLLGLGIGGEGTSSAARERKFIAPHNDYLSILMTTGIMGLLIYFIILGTILAKIVSLRQRKIKYLFLGMFISVLIMGAVSNSYIGRFEMTQLFWLFMGLLYCQDQLIPDEGFDQAELAVMV